VDGQDVGVLQSGREPDLALEPFGAERSGELGEEDLECNRTVMADVAGQIDRGHPTAPERALERVAVAEASGQLSGRIVGSG
jgi:hypothetical protein